MARTKKCQFLLLVYFLLVQFLFLLVLPGLGIYKVSGGSALVNRLVIPTLAGSLFWIFSLILGSLLCVIVMIITLGSKDTYVQSIGAFFGFAAVMISNYKVFDLTIQFLNKMLVKSDISINIVAPLGALLCFALVGLLFAITFWFTSYGAFEQERAH